MKKQRLRIAPVFVLSILLVLILTACGHEHVYGKWTVEKEATCTENGSQVRMCECGKKETKEIAAQGHREGAWVVDKESTCTEIGRKRLTCAACNITINAKRIDAKGHTDGEWVLDQEATCTEKGSKHLNCSVCSETIKTESIDAKGHTDGEWVVDQEATCTENGSKNLICSVCSETIRTEILPNLGGHIYEVDSMEAGGLVGSKITYKCATCSHTYEKVVGQIELYVRLTSSSSATINGYGSFSKSYTASASGGYGEYQFKYEVFASSTSNTPLSHLTVDYSGNNTYSISYRGYENAISGYILRVSVRDEAGNIAVYNYTM